MRIPINFMICRKVFALFFLVAASAGVAYSQVQACKVRLADLPAAPEMSGFRLGMTPDQVKARVPQVKFGQANEFGVAKTSINPDFDPRIDKTNFTDVRTVSLDFLDGQVSSLWIGFEGAFKWKTTEEFVKGISHELSLPDEWTTRGRNQMLTCADFQLTVGMIAGGPSLRIVDLTAEETIAARRQAKEDEVEATSGAEDQTPVIGDTRNRVYYQKDCEALKAVPEKSRIAFESNQAAQKAGFKRAEACR